MEAEKAEAEKCKVPDVPVPKETLARLLDLTRERQAIESRIQDIGLASMEALGLDYRAYALDVGAGKFIQRPT
jgi:hypothetical protein